MIPSIERRTIGVGMDVTAVEHLIPLVYVLLFLLSPIHSEVHESAAIQCAQGSSLTLAISRSMPKTTSPPSIVWLLGQIGAIQLPDIRSIIASVTLRRHEIGEIVRLSVGGEASAEVSNHDDNITIGRRIAA